jgi:predicted nucleic acid-binding protein
MSLSNIPDGAEVFLDANIFVYHFCSEPQYGPDSRNLLDRVSRNRLQGFTASDVLNDVAHRVMTVEAANKYGWPMTGIAYKLQKHPDELKSLTWYRQAIDEVIQIGIQVLSVDAAHVVAAASLSQQFGLLSGDALIAAVMQANGLTNIASNDADFDRVPWITHFAPAP